MSPTHGTLADLRSGDTWLGRDNVKVTTVERVGDKVQVFGRITNGRDRGRRSSWTFPADTPVEYVR